MRRNKRGQERDRRGEEGSGAEGEGKSVKRRAADLQNPSVISSAGAVGKQFNRKYLIHPLYLLPLRSTTTSRNSLLRTSRSAFPTIIFDRRTTSKVPTTLPSSAPIPILSLCTSSPDLSPSSILTLSRVPR